MNSNDINFFSEVDKYLDHALETEKKATSHATAAATLVIDILNPLNQLAPQKKFVKDQ